MILAGFLQEVSMHNSQNANHRNRLHDAHSDQLPFLG